MNEHIYDVIQVGYGPVGEALALMLGRQGRSVAVCERWETRYPMPRAVCLDHELYRVLSANGMGEVLPSITHPSPPYQWFNADWQELLVLDMSLPSISGGTDTNFIHQPTLEQALDEAVRDQPGVELFLGWEVTAISQDADLAHISLCKVGTGEERTLSARYVIGCDGANSVVRETIGGEREDRGFEADWLVIDVMLKPGVTIEQLGIPPSGQYCNPLRPTTIVPAGVRDGQYFRRWEFMRLPGESIEELERESKVWELLEPWADPDQVDLVRHKVYNFRSLMAERWHDRRLILAGDAAHVMPPFMGQGMCSGFRDAWNLTWKLGLILDGKADDRLLDTYQPERLSHVRQITDISIYLGQIICIPDPIAAAERDQAFLSGEAPPPPPFPSMVEGIVHRSADGSLESGAGLLSPHVELHIGGGRKRLDEALGSGFVVIGRGFDPQDSLDENERRRLEIIGTRYLALDADGANAARDAEGRLDTFLDERGWAAMIVRPDFYIYGGISKPGDLADLVDDLLRDLKKAGVCPSD